MFRGVIALKDLAGCCHRVAKSVQALHRHVRFLLLSSFTVLIIAYWPPNPILMIKAPIVCRGALEIVGLFRLSLSIFSE